jgi:plasmid stabilization system protein ParE
MDRIWKTPVLVLATVYFVLDGLFSYVTRPITAWISKKQTFERTRRWIVSLRPYPSLALFAVPGDHPGAGKASGRILGGNRSFFRGRHDVHCGRGVEAELRRAAISAQSKQAAVHSGVCWRIQILAADDGCGRIA